MGISVDSVVVVVVGGGSGGGDANCVNKPEVSPIPKQLKNSGIRLLRNRMSD